MSYYRIKRQYTIIPHSKNVVELRYGAWNPISITLSDESESGRMSDILQRLNGSASVSDIVESENIPQSDIEKVIDKLKDLNLLETQPTHALDYYLDSIIPNLTIHENRVALPNNFTAFGDKTLAARILAILKDSRMQSVQSMEYANPHLHEALCQLSLLSNTNPLDSAHAMKPFEALSDHFIMYITNRVNPLELQAMNHICLHYRIPWLQATIDGPYLLIGPTFIPHRSPCYSCLESRILMNMRDSAAYKRYKSEILNVSSSESDFPLNPVLGAMIASLTAFDALNYLLTGASFTIGKMLSIYLPDMEFMFNEVLRVPDCPACAPRQEIDDSELFFDIRSLID